MKKRVKHLSIRLSRKQHQELLQTLTKEGMTKSELVRIALADYITKKQE